MKKTNRKLHLTSQTLRNLVLAPKRLAGVIGGGDHVSDDCTNARLVPEAKVSSADCNG